MNVRRRDLVLALVVAGLVVAGTSHIHPDAGHARAVDAWAWICGLAGAVALLGWRRLPLAMLGIVAAEVFAYQALNFPGGPALLPAPVCLVLLGYRARRPIAFAGAVLMAAVVIGGGVIGQGTPSTIDAVSTGWVLAAVLAGQIAAAQVERRELTRHQAATDERLRIAQDLHDSVAHAMATINVQAGVAGHLLDRRPEQVRVALEAIRMASSEVLDELGAILSVLRQGGGADAAPRAPVATLDRLAELVDRARADGLTIDCTIAGDTVSVPLARSAAAYRVVQEALSNTRRHAGDGATATIRVTVDNDHGTNVAVIDDGGRARVPAISTASGSGLGLVGMRERVESTGGLIAVRTNQSARVSGRGDVAMIRVVLADDQLLVRSGFRALLDAEDDIEVVGEATDGAEALQLVGEHHPDVVLMDIRMPGMDGLTAAREIAARDDLASTRVLVLTTFELDEYVYEALRAGASGFLVKHTEPAELIRAVRVVAAGEALLSPSVTRRLISTFTDASAGSPPGPPPRETQSLTDREREVIALVADGLSNDEIAERWFVSNATVRTHVSRAMTKLAARDRAQLVVFAYRYGLAKVRFGHPGSSDVEPGSQR